MVSRNEITVDGRTAIVWTGGSGGYGVARGSGVQVWASVRKPRGERDMTKTEFERAVADVAGVEKRTAAAVLDALEEVVTNNVRRGEAVTIRPGFIKVSRKDVKARKAREGTNPFTGEPTVFKGRPASKTAKVTALKKLKDGVAAKRR